MIFPQKGPHFSVHVPVLLGIRNYTSVHTAELSSQTEFEKKTFCSINRAVAEKLDRMNRGYSYVSEVMRPTLSIVLRLL